MPPAPSLWICRQEGMGGEAQGRCCWPRRNGKWQWPLTALAEKVSDMSATCRHNSQMSAHIAQMPLSWRHNFDPDTFFLCLDLPTSTKFSSIVPEVHTENSSVRFGQNICLISVRHGRSSSSRHQNLKSSQLPELFQHIKLPASNNICCHSIS